VSGAAIAPWHQVRREAALDRKAGLSRYSLDPTEHARITSLVRGAHTEGRAKEDDLREAVYAVVEQARRRATPPEQLLAAIKAAAKEGATPLDPEADAVVKRVVTWCIHGYYGLEHDQPSQDSGQLGKRV
jgi:hypothetical protein